ncbi:MAG: hypothetical protein FWC34_02305 [Bacteroidetes bacterium]|nr:hypothetical protein [Bacteroidota bacterium]MCL2301709.1 hypothetical protein [Lentimicrobiaceae bacterium]
MKKIIIVWIGLLLMGFSVVAQEITENMEVKIKSKKERKERTDKLLLPEQGNWAIGVDVLPLLRTLGTVFWGGDEPMGFQGTPYTFGNIPYPNVSIMGKYMLTNTCALRANLGVVILSNTRAYNVRDDAAFFIDNSTVATVTDYNQSNAYGVSLAIGAEHRCGKKRVVGIFGGDLLFGYHALSNKYTYGNIMTEFNQAPTTFSNYYYPTSTSASTRTLFEKEAGIISIGAQVTAGIEVFVAPKIALGGQVNLSYVFTHYNQTHREAEGFNELSGKVEKRTDIQNPARWRHKFDTNNLGGSLYMIFYF